MVCNYRCGKVLESFLLSRACIVFAAKRHETCSDFLMKGPRTDKGAYLLLLKDIMLEGIEIDFVVVARLRLLHLSSTNLTGVTIASINIRVSMCLSIRVISAHLSRLPDLCYNIHSLP